MATIEVPDAKVFPPREQAEKGMVKFFESDGLIVHGLEITNYAVSYEEQEGE